MATMRGPSRASIERRRAPITIPEWSDIETAWLAGMIEGEGSVQVQGRCPHLKFVSTDKDVVERVARMLGEECMANRTTSPWSKKQQWRAIATGQRAILAMLRILPHMGLSS